MTFETVDGNATKVTMRSVFPSKNARDFVVRTYNAVEGGQQTLGRLAEHLQQMSGAGPANPPFVITRVFNVPLETMWQAWTESDQLTQWFGPKGLTISRCTLDLRPGGTFHYCMRGPDGNEMWGKWVFREITPPERLVFLASFADEQGNVIRAPFSADWPLEMLSVITFAKHAGIGRGTVVRIQGSAFNATAAEQQTFDASHGSMQIGWTGTLDQLAGFLAAERTG